MIADITMECISIDVIVHFIEIIIGTIANNFDGVENVLKQFLIQI